MFKKLKEIVRWQLYKGLYKPGHFYSTIPSLQYVKEQNDYIFNSKPPDAVDLHLDTQKKLLAEFEKFVNDFDWPAEQTDSHRYYYNNSYFIRPDAFALYAMIRLYKPKRIIEIGSGFSSAVMMDTNDRYLDKKVNINFIEPYPDRLYSLMRSDDNKHYQVIPQFIQQVPLDMFTQLQANDILFIDSSHVSKVGSDLNHIMFYILPKLNKGVIIHFHDITYPFEYLKEWIMQGTYWNEIYMLRAFLMYNQTFEIMLMNHYWKDTELKKVPYIKGGGGSLWLRKTDI